MQNKDNSFSIALPKGVKDFLPEMAGRMRRIEEKISTVFQLWGYREVRTPIIEYLDVLALGEPDLLQSMFKFEDRTSGKVLSLRPDITAQIARFTSSHLKNHPKPLRFHYNGTVLQYGKKGSDSRREVCQSGLELIGLGQPEADGEVVAIAIESLKAVGLEDFKIDIGQVEFYKGVMEGLSLPCEVLPDLESAIARKDRSATASLVEKLNLSTGDEEIIRALPNLVGDRSVIDRASSMTVNSRAMSALENLSQVLDTIDSYSLMDHITIDLGEIRGLNYYTGIIFEGFVPGMGEEVCGGGRYDSLLNRYGYDSPATGFAIDIENLLKAMEKRGKTDNVISADLLLVDRSDDKRETLKVAALLRGKGIKVARAIKERNDEDSLSYARSESINRVAFLGGDGVKDDEIRIEETDRKESVTCKINDLVDGHVEILKGKRNA